MGTIDHGTDLSHSLHIHCYRLRYHVHAICSLSYNIPASERLVRWAVRPSLCGHGSRHDRSIAVHAVREQKVPGASRQSRRQSIPGSAPASLHGGRLPGPGRTVLVCLDKLAGHPLDGLSRRYRALRRRQRAPLPVLHQLPRRQLRHLHGVLHGRLIRPAISHGRSVPLIHQIHVRKTWSSLGFEHSRIFVLGLCPVSILVRQVRSRYQEALPLRCECAGTGRQISRGARAMLGGIKEKSNGYKYILVCHCK